MKKAIKVLALALCAGSTILMAACGGTVSYKTTTSPNWEIRNPAGGELNENSDRLTRKEVATYAITFEKGSNTSYSFEYNQGGTYSTEFYAVKYDWNDASVPEEYRLTDTTDVVYAYKTTLALTGSVTVNGAKRDFSNAVTTVSYFRSADNNLTPVYSKQDIVCTSPNAIAPADLASAYVEVDCLYEVFYNRDGNSAIIETTDRSAENPEKQTASAGVGSEYSVFDASYVAMAMRSFTTSGTHTIDLMRAAEKQTSRFTVACGGELSLDRENESFSTIVSALDGAVDSGYLIAGKNDENVINYSYNELTLALASEMPGPASTYWYAHVSNSELNTCRAALIRMSETMPFNLGNIVYSLSSLEYITI